MARAIRHTLAITGGVMLVLALAGPAAAAKPDRSFAEAGDILVSGYCDFDVIEHPLENNEYATTYFDRDSNVTRTHVAGHLVLELINVDSDSSIVVNASGPGRFVEDAHGLTVYTGGTWMLNFAGEFFALNGRGIFRVAPTARRSSPSTAMWSISATYSPANAEAAGSGQAPDESPPPPLSASRCS